MVTLLAPVPAGAGGFQTGPQNYPVGVGPVFVITADLRGNGRKDIIVSNPNISSGMGTLGSTISVLLNNGNGTYAAAMTFNVGVAPVGIAVADFNGDNHLDLAVANAGSNTVSILLGKGDGTFTAGGTITVGNNPVGVFAADLNGDGKADLVVTNSDLFGSDNCASSSVSILLGNGNGTFTPASPATVQAGACPLDAAIVDLNGDGKLDLVVVNDGGMKSTATSNVSVLLGNGNGTFKPAMNFAVGSRPEFVTVADFNGDKKLDLAVNNEGGKSTGGVNGGISVLLGNGDGTFQAATTVLPGIKTGSVTAGDFNNDGKIDLAAPANSGNGALAVLLGNGNGTFQAPIMLGVNNITFGIAAADVNGDGNLDLAVPVDNFPNPGDVAVLLGNGNGTFQGGINSYNLCNNCSPESISVADFNNDGKLDLGVGLTQFTNCTPNCSVAALVGTLIGNGDGTFAAPPSTFTGGVPGATNGSGIATGVFKTGGNQDMVLSQNSPSSTGQFSYFAGNGNDTFQTQVTTAVSFNPFQDAATDFDGDGKLDLALGECSGVAVALGKGDGTFGTFNVLNAGSFCVSGQIATGQVFASGRPDIVVGDVDSSNNLNAYIFQNTGSGNFAAAAVIKAGTVTGFTGGPIGAALGHFKELTSANHLDIALTNPTANTITILTNKGDGTFTAGQTLTVGATPQYIAVGDFDGDGHLDLAVANCGNCVGNNGSTASVSVLYGNGDGTFTSVQKPIQTYTPGNGSDALAIGDFNRDGAPDLAVGNANANDVTILLNTGGTSVSLMSSANPANAGQSVTFTATVKGTVISSTATGTVQFMDGASPLGSAVALSNGSATLMTSALSVGAHSITAAYSGDPNYNPHTSSVFTQNITAAPTTTTIATSLNPAFMGQAFTLTATVTGCGGTTPTGSVTFNQDMTGFPPASLDVNGQATLTLAFANPAKVGNNPTFAAYNGSATCAPSTSSTFNEVGELDITTTTLSSGTNPGTAGTPVTFTASVTSSFVAPNGTVTFTATGQATPPPVTLPTSNNISKMVTQSFTFASSGSFNVQASYSPNDGLNAASTSTVLVENINCAGCVNTTTAINTPIAVTPLDRGEPANTVRLRQTATFTVTVAPASGTTAPTGKVQLVDHGVSIGSLTSLVASGSNGVATIPVTGLTLGPHSFVAVYGGDGVSFNPSDSTASPLAVQVSPKPH